VTDPTAKAQISTFARGVKQLGLWEQMVCWPLRSAQNAGTGTTAYSLGGLGTYNGTLVNGPTWGADGISFLAASSTRILTPNSIEPLDSFSMFSVGKYVNSSEVSLVLFGMGNGKGSVVGIYGNSDTRLRNVSWKEDASSLGVRTGPATNNLWFSGAFSNNSSGATSYINSSAIETISGDYRLGSTLTSSPGIGANILNSPGSANSHFNGDVAIAALFKTDLSGPQLTAIRDLYKETIGQGLGLP